MFFFLILHAVYSHLFLSITVHSINNEISFIEHIIFPHQLP